MCKNIQTGYIKLFRSIKDWSWYDDANTLALFIHLLVGANWEDDSVWHGEQLARGELITSVAKLSAETGLSPKQVRICLDRLVDGGEVVKQGTNKYTKITICNYATYQGRDEDAGQTNGEQTANKGQTKGKQRATSKEIKNIRIQEGEREKEIIIKKERESKNTIIDRIYSLYPSKCPVRNASTGKSHKCKEKIARLLNDHTEEELTNLIKSYLKENYNQHYLLNFETFLNKLPDCGQQDDASLFPNQPESRQKAIVRKSPEDMAKDAFAKRQTIIRNVRQAINIVWPEVPKARVDAALTAAGYNLSQE